MSDGSALLCKHISEALRRAVARARACPGRVFYVVERFQMFPPLVPRLNASPVFVTLGYRVTALAHDVATLAPILEGQTAESIAGRVVFSVGGLVSVCSVHVDKNKPQREGGS